jgi:hypothetical protein
MAGKSVTCIVASAEAFDNIWTKFAAISGFTEMLNELLIDGYSLVKSPRGINVKFPI